jgi:hypothetical protein
MIPAPYIVYERRTWRLQGGGGGGIRYNVKPSVERNITEFLEDSAIQTETGNIILITVYRWLQYESSLMLKQD